MDRDDARAREAGYADWLIVAASAASMIVYFVTSLGARGQALFVIEAAVKVLAKLGFHA